MKAFVVLAAVLACASAKPGLLLHPGLSALGLTAAPAQAVISAPLTYSAPVVYSAPVIAPVVTKSQYHSQDELGQASYGHQEPSQAHAAFRDINGNVVGSYAYINPEGKEVRVQYTAGHGGFQVVSNDLPVAPGVPAAPALVVPVAPEDTEEVKKAKEEHAKAIAEAKARNEEADKADAAKDEEGNAKSRRKRGIIAAPIAYAAPATVVAHPAAVTYGAVLAAPTTIVAAPTVREATLTKVVNTPLHAVSYRVD